MSRKWHCQRLFLGFWAILGVGSGGSDGGYLRPGHILLNPEFPKNDGFICAGHIQSALNRLQCVIREQGCSILRQSDPQRPPYHMPVGGSKGDICFLFQGKEAESASYLLSNLQNY
jgi:hypothetical protein